MQFRKYIILGIGILSLGLWACGKDNSDDAAESEIGQENIAESQEEMETATTESASENVAEDRDLQQRQWHMPENISYAESKVIADNCDMWLNFMDYANEVEAYAVTDLDKNGRAEIIVSNMGGTGYYTYTRIFEINEEHDGLEEVKTDFVEGNSQPDMISFGEPVTVYIDNDFVHHYIMEDYLKATAAEYYNVIYDVTLQEGQLSCQVLARRSELYTDGSEKVEYEDGRGLKITEEIYRSITDNVFSDANRKETHIWGWQDLEELKDLSNEELRKKIDESFLKQEVLP